MRRALRARVPERVGEDQPALGVRVRHLDGEAGGGRDHVRRPDRVGADHVLAGREDAEDGERQPELGDRAERGEHRRAAGHVALLAHDVRLGLEEVAARVEGDGLADEREPRPLGRARGLVAQDDELRRRRARPAHGGERREAGGDRIEDVDAEAGERGGALGEAAGVTTFGGPSTSSRATFVHRATSSARAAIAQELVVLARAADDEAVDAGGGSVALPATRAGSRRGRRPRRPPAPGGTGRAAATRRAPRRPCRRRGARAPPGPPPSAGPPARRRRARSGRPAARAARAPTAPPSPGPRPPPRAPAAHRRAGRAPARADRPLQGRGRRPPPRPGRRRSPRRSSRARVISIIAGRARSNSRLCRRRRLPAVELPLPDVRGRPHGHRRASADAVVARDPRGGRSVVPRQRLARPAPAARGARRRRRGRRPRRARGRGPADGRGDRPRGGPAAAARVLDARSGSTAATRSAGP